jgi:hypothetical protein
MPVVKGHDYTKVNFLRRGVLPFFSATSPGFPLNRPQKGIGMGKKGRSRPQAPGLGPGDHHHTQNEGRERAPGSDNERNQTRAPHRKRHLNLSKLLLLRWPENKRLPPSTIKGYFGTVLKFRGLLFVLPLRMQKTNIL